VADVCQRPTLRVLNGLASPGLLFVFLLLIAVRAFAGGVTLAWDPVNHPSLVGYMVYYGPAAGNYTSSIDVGNTTSYAVPTWSKERLTTSLRPRTTQRTRRVVFPTT